MPTPPILIPIELSRTVSCIPSQACLNDSGTAMAALQPTGCNTQYPKGICSATSSSLVHGQRSTSWSKRIAPGNLAPRACNLAFQSTCFLTFQVTTLQFAICLPFLSFVGSQRSAFRRTTRSSTGMSTPISFQTSPKSCQPLVAPSQLAKSLPCPPRSLGSIK